MTEYNDFDPRIETSIFGHAIHQRLISNGFVVSEWIAYTREKQLRDALIELGWTPPKDAGVKGGTP